LFELANPLPNIAKFAVRNVIAPPVALGQQRRAAGWQRQSIKWRAGASARQGQDRRLPKHTTLGES